jgi:lipoate-protein ligase A
MSGAAWRVTSLQVGDAATLLTDGMARFDALADDPVPTLRWYRTTTPAIVLGRGQGSFQVHGGDIAVVGRHSGGGAVWLSPDVLSLDVLLPAGHPWVADRLTAVFDHVGTAWLHALRSLGVPHLSAHRGASTARLRGSDRERLRAAVCYATRGRGEVFWNDRKLVGLAQRRRQHATMVQCGLLRRWRPARLLAALGADPHDAQITVAAVGLDDICARPPDDDAVMAAVHTALTDATGSPAR